MAGSASIAAWAAPRSGGRRGSTRQRRRRRETPPSRRPADAGCPSQPAGAASCRDSGRLPPEVNAPPIAVRANIAASPRACPTPPLRPQCLSRSGSRLENRGWPLRHSAISQLGDAALESAIARTGRTGVVMPLATSRGRVVRTGTSRGQHQHVNSGLMGAAHQIEAHSVSVAGKAIELETTERARSSPQLRWSCHRRCRASRESAPSAQLPRDSDRPPATRLPARPWGRHRSALRRAPEQLGVEGRQPGGAP
jgi:hypothetical protein